MINKLKLKNYKAFYEEQELELKPITILIGKNSSGKSSIAKLPTLLEKSFSGEIDSPLEWVNNGIMLGSEFKDLVHNRSTQELEFTLDFEMGCNVYVGLALDEKNNPLVPVIYKWKFKDYNFLFLKEEKMYSYDGELYDLKFKGMIPYSIIRQKDHLEILGDINLPDLSFNVDYIGPFRMKPERSYTNSGKINYIDVGAEGENAYAILYNSKLQDTDLFEKVSDWYGKYFDGWYLDITIESEFKVLLENKRKGLKVNLADVGQGMSQALPLVVRAFMDGEPSLIILEQPELHLHPAAHADLMELFVLSAKDKKHKYIIETHSENILLRLRKLIVDERFDLNSDDVIIYWVDQEDAESTIQPINIDAKGQLSDWPEGVFNENIKELLEIREINTRQSNDNNN